jgi:mannose-6-phosphate isomerase
MTDLYPLRFQPVLKQYIWGGRRLGEMLGKPIGEDANYAESWEIVDRTPEQSIVIAGKYAGQTLRQLCQTLGAQLTGQTQLTDRFPLLIKLLDAQQLLSVQVHPNDAQAKLRTPPDLGKTEAWYVLHAEPGAKLYAGLKRGFDRAALERELTRGTCELCLHQIEPQVGDLIFIPPGTVHALGAGLIIAEFQQSSDVTLRLFDWNRVGPDGQPRPLHIAEALPIIDYARGPIQPIRQSVALASDTPGLRGEQLLSCDKFSLNRWHAQGTVDWQNTGNLCRIWMVTAGELRLSNDPVATPLTVGQTVLIPAGCLQTSMTAQPGTTWLECLLP